MPGTEGGKAVTYALTNGRSLDFKLFASSSHDTSKSIETKTGWESYKYLEFSPDVSSGRSANGEGVIEGRLTAKVPSSELRIAMAGTGVCY